MACAPIGRSCGKAGCRVTSPARIWIIRRRSSTTRAREEPYSYYGVTLTPGVAWLITKPALLLKAELAFGERRYGDPDPLFGETRVDNRIRLDLSVRSKQWRWMNFSPALVFSVEKTESSIGFYSYEKTNLSLAME